MKLFCYLRVSTAGQADSGLGLDAQDARCRAYAAAMGHDLLAVVAESASGATLDRPALADIARQLRRGEADGLLVARLDRLTRRVRDLFDLVEPGSDPARPLVGLFAPGGSALLSVADHLDTSSAMGRFALGLLGLLAQWERETIGERTSAALGALAARGAYTGGGVPYGFRVGDDGALVPDPAEHAAAGLARAGMDAGMSLRAIGRALSDAGYLPRGGGEWDPTAVRRLVARRLLGPEGSRG